MSNENNVLVVTRHPALVQYLIETKVIRDGGFTLHDHAEPEMVTGKDVIGVLPHALSVLTNSFTEVPMDIPAEMRGKELTIEHMRMFARPPITYVVNHA